MPSTLHNKAYRDLIGALAKSRANAGLTQQALADRLDRPQSFVAKVEGLERRLDVIEFLTMAREIGVDPLPLLSDAAKKIGARGRRGR